MEVKRTSDNTIYSDFLGSISLKINAQCPSWQSGLLKYVLYTLESIRKVNKKQLFKVFTPIKGAL